VLVGFVLKTVDVIHLIARQTNIDIFFMDWERSKAGGGESSCSSRGETIANLGNMNSVSTWRTCFVANEFNEIQTFRRIHLPFQLFFVLFLLKVEHCVELVDHR
jgi:meckelin